MTEDSQRDESPPEETASAAEGSPSAGRAPRSPESVFGNLPDARPGTRSPRRRSQGEGSAARSRAAKPAAAKSASKPTTARVSPETAAKVEPTPGTGRPAADAAGKPETERPGGIEDLAWAGVAAAAEAATLGIRLASRAFDALRGSSERD